MKYGKKRLALLSCLFILSILVGSFNTPLVKAIPYTFIPISDIAVMGQPFTYPQALYVPTVNTTYFVFQEISGTSSKTYAKMYNHTTGVTSDSYWLWDQPAGGPFPNDPHYSGSIGMLYNGKLIVAGNVHGDHPAEGISYRISTVAYQISAWDAEGHHAGYFTYPQMVTFFGDTLKLYARITVGIGSGQYDEYWTEHTFNSSGNWLGDRLIAQSMGDTTGHVQHGGFYALFNKQGNNIHMAAHLFNETTLNTSPLWTEGNDRANLYYAYSSDKGVTWKTAADVSITLPLTFLNSKIVDMPSTIPLQVGIGAQFTTVSGDGKPRIIYMRGAMNDSDLGMDRYWTNVGEARWTGSAWETAYIQDQSGRYLNASGGHHTWLSYSTIAPKTVTFASGAILDNDFNRLAFWFPDPDTHLLTRWMAATASSTGQYVSTAVSDQHVGASNVIAAQNYVFPFEAYANIDDNYVSGDHWFYITNEQTFFYTFYGEFNEDTGLLNPALTRAVNVTAYFSDGSASETFEVDGTYYYAATSQPLYFSFATSSNRQYWLESTETSATIYIFDSSLSAFTINFLDLAAVLDTHPFVEIQRYVNGSLAVVEKRKVDVENKIVASLVAGQKYTIVLKGDSTYTFGDLAITASPIQLTLRGVDFPKETLLTYKYIRIYSYRYFGSPSGNITVVYQDLLLMTTSVHIDLYYKNDTFVAHTTQTSDSFSYTFLTIANNTDYKISAIITHERYGAYEWRQYFARSFSVAPWALGWMGSLTGITTSVLLPIFLIVAVAGLFSQINAEVGAIMACLIALLLTYMGWINIAAGSLVTAFFLAFCMAIVYAKRRVSAA